MRILRLIFLLRNYFGNFLTTSSSIQVMFLYDFGRSPKNVLDLFQHLNIIQLL